jgi:hypothetical protein
LALLHKGQVELALGSFDKSATALTQVAHAPSVTEAAARTAAQVMSLLPDRSKTPGDVILHPNITPVRSKLADAISHLKSDQASVADRVKLGKDDIHRLDLRLQNLQYEIPDFSNVDIRPDSRIEGALYDIYHMFKDVNLVFDKSSYLIDQSDGIIRDDAGVLDQMNAPLKGNSIGGDTLTLLPSYGDIDAQMTTSSSELVGGVTAARGAIALAWQAVPAMDQYFRKLDTMGATFGGDLSPRDSQDLKPLALAAFQQLDAAAAAAETAQTMFYAAQARQIQARITLLGLGYPQGRYDTLTHVISRRLGVDPPTYDEALRLDINPGDVAAASWLAAEEKIPVSTVINEQRSTETPFVDMALSKHLSMESMEVILGLMWEGYAEKPNAPVATTNVSNPEPAAPATPAPSASPR